MKKILVTILFTLMSLGCIACKTKYETAVCTIIPEDAAGVSIQIILDAENDIVQTLTQQTTIELAYYQEKELESLDKVIDFYEEIYQNYSGVEFRAEVKDNEIYYETLIVDMTNKNTVTSLRKNDLLPLEGEANKTSLHKTIKHLESLDWNIDITTK